MKHRSPRQPASDQHNLTHTTSVSGPQSSNAIFTLHRLSADGRMVIVRAADLYPCKVDGYRLPASDVLKSLRAASWMEAKVNFGFPLTTSQQIAEDERLVYSLAKLPPATTSDAELPVGAMAVLGEEQ